MTINREHLEPCPFCGGQADPHQFTRKRWSVDCSSCGAEMISSSTKRDAIESWNTRAQSQASPDDSSPNAVWLTQAHTICADAGIPSGNIVDRLELLSQWVTDRLHDGAQAAPEAEPAAWVPSAALAKLRNGSNNAPCVLTDGPAEFNETAVYLAPQHDAELVELRDLRPVLAMILNALDRDAAEGKAARGEMAEELRAKLATLSAKP